MSKSKDGATSRRNFLKLAATGAPAAVAAATLGAQSAQAAPVDLEADTMQDTAHTRAYLESCRF